MCTFVSACRHAHDLAWCFRALQDGWPPISWAIGDEGHECGASGRTQLDTWSPLPPGFEVAPDGLDTRHVCRVHAWSTQALVLANGDAVWTGYWGRHTTSKAGAAVQRRAALLALNHEPKQNAVAFACGCHIFTQVAASAQEQPTCCSGLAAATMAAWNTA